MDRERTIGERMDRVEIGLRRLGLATAAGLVATILAPALVWVLLRDRQAAPERRAVPPQQAVVPRALPAAPARREAAPAIEPRDAPAEPQVDLDDLRRLTTLVEQAARRSQPDLDSFVVRSRWDSPGNCVFLVSSTRKDPFADPPPSIQAFTCLNGKVAEQWLSEWAFEWFFRDDADIAESLMGEPRFAEFSPWKILSHDRRGPGEMVVRATSLTNGRTYRMHATLYTPGNLKPELSTDASPSPALRIVREALGPKATGEGPGTKLLGPKIASIARDYKMTTDDVADGVIGGMRKATEAGKPITPGQLLDALAEAGKLVQKKSSTTFDVASRSYLASQAEGRSREDIVRFMVDAMIKNR